MADAGQRARRLGAKASRRKAVVAAKKHAEGPRGLSDRVRIAASCPIARCVAPANLFEIGIGHLIIARTLPSGLLGCGFFLVDPFCLGVKDAFYAEIGPDELASKIAAQSETQLLTDANPAMVRKLINEAVDYASGVGLAPHKDFKAVEPIFGAVDAGTSDETFTFGKDGRPFYVTGPLDTPARIRSICGTLEKRCGIGGWHYLIGGPPAR